MHESAVLQPDGRVPGVQSQAGIQMFGEHERHNHGAGVSDDAIDPEPQGKNRIGEKMQISESGIAFLKAREGFFPVISSDVGHPVIGHGHDLTPAEIALGTFKNGISRDEGDLLLRKDLSSRYEPILNDLLPPETNQNQYDACGSFAYNEGTHGFATMIHHGLDQVPTQMPAWHFTHINGVLVSDDGLATRRALEVALFTTPC